MWTTSRGDSEGAFHYAKDSGNFGRNSNGKVRFGFFWPEYSGSPLEVVHIFRSEYSDRNSPFHFALIKYSIKEFKMATAISIVWPDLIGKCRSIFHRYSLWSLTGQFGIMESTPNISVRRNRNGPFHFNSDRNFRNLWHNGRMASTLRF